MIFNKVSLIAIAFAASYLSTAHAVECKSRLVALQIGTDTSCQSGPTGYYPIHDIAPSDCHGWKSADDSHVNSANNFTCNADGSFSLTQFAGNLECNGTGVTKTFYIGQCHQDIPPVLWSKATDLSCCEDPVSEACLATYGAPIKTAQVDASIYLNGELCDEDGNSDPAPAPVTPSPPTSPVRPIPPTPTVPTPPTEPVSPPSQPSSGCGGGGDMQAQRPGGNKFGGRRLQGGNKMGGGSGQLAGSINTGCNKIGALKAAGNNGGLKSGGVRRRRS